MSSALYVAVSIRLITRLISTTYNDFSRTKVTKTQPKKAESNSISLETIHEDSLEEGLLESTKQEEDSKSLPPLPLDREFTSPKTASA